MAKASHTCHVGCFHECLLLVLLQDEVRFVFGHRGHTDPEIYSLEQLLPARWVLSTAGWYKMLACRAVIMC